MPYNQIEDLPDVVRGALPDPAQRTWLNVFNSAYDSDACKDLGDKRDACAIRQAWATVGRQYQKGDDGKWTKIGNLSTFETVSNLIHSPHDVTLQRLDTLIKAGDESILYQKRPFENTSAWSGIPVIFAHTAPGEPAIHPKHTAVSTGTLDNSKYTVVGTTAGTYISETGEPLLKTQIVFTDEKVDNLAKEGKLSLSTGFEAITGRTETGQKAILGNVTPNHVLVFLRGGCPNCYPNDNSAMFNNLKEDEPMEEEKIKNGLVGALKEYFGNVTPKPTEATKEEIMDVKETEEFKNLISERDALKTELDNLKAEKAQTEKDLRWDTLKNTIPVGWLGEKEVETRKDFETNPAAFAVKLVEFSNTAGNPKAAEGSDITPEKLDNLAKAEKQISDFEQKTGFHFVE